MNYRDVCERLEAFLAARDACSREWALSDAMVMCVELDLGALGALALEPGASVLDIPFRTPPIRISYFGLDGGKAVGIDSRSLTPDESRAAGERYSEVMRWSRGEIGRLPPSTSTHLADRVRHRRGR